MKYIKLFEKNITYYFIVQIGGHKGIGEIGYIYVFIVTKSDYERGLNATENNIPYNISSLLDSYGNEIEDSVWEIDANNTNAVKNSLTKIGIGEKPFQYEAEPDSIDNDKEDQYYEPKSKKSKKQAKFHGEKVKLGDIIVTTDYYSRNKIYLIIYIDKDISAFEILFKPGNKEVYDNTIGFTINAQTIDDYDKINDGKTYFSDLSNCLLILPALMNRFGSNVLVELKYIYNDPHIEENFEIVKNSIKYNL